MNINNETELVVKELIEETVNSRVRIVLEECYERAEAIHDTHDDSELVETLGALFPVVSSLAEARHAARGVVLTLASYKIVVPDQDIRRHKAEFENGFSARRVDSLITVPFLEQHSLHYNVESHWLTQTFSFAGHLDEGVVLKTVPKIAGPLSIEVLQAIENHDDISLAKAVVTLILLRLIEIRNKGHVPLTKPKNLSIDKVIILLKAHFSYHYKTNAPRLPQIAIFTLYECLMDTVERYSTYSLRPLERMKAANRKSGSVGDIDVEFNKQPVEAVEIKFQIPISKLHVAEAIQKIKTASVERYFILSTSGVSQEDLEDINIMKDSFLKSNGCELIINGVFETIRYYLRLLRSTNDFINRYTQGLEIDADLDYEHKLAWNEICVVELT